MNTGQASLESVLTPSFPEWGERAGEREEGDGERESGDVDCMPPQ